MQREYLNDLNHNYLSIKFDGDSEEFSTKMLTENSLPGLLSCEMRFMNGESWLYYDISQIQSIENIYVKRNMTETEFKRLLKDWYKAQEQMEDFFLSKKLMMLKPEYVYQNLESGKFVFMAVPEKLALHSEKSDIDLAEFLLSIVEHKSEQVTDQLYCLHEEVSQNCCNLKTYIEHKEKMPRRASTAEYYKENIKEKESSYMAEDAISCVHENENFYGTAVSEAENEQDIVKKQEFQSAPNEGDEKKNKVINIIKLSLFLVTAGALIGHIMIKYLGISIERTVGIILMILVAIGLFWNIHKSNIEQKKEEKQDNIKVHNKISSSNHLGNQTDEECISEAGFACAQNGILEKEQELNQTVFMEIHREHERKLYGTDKYKKQRILLQAFPFTVGKSVEYTDYQLQDHSVSRIHARIILENEKLWLIDLNSTNGTFHNGLRMQPNQKMELEPEDEVGFGKVTFIYR